jgi:hypothetical protein
MSDDSSHGIRPPQPTRRAIVEDSVSQLESQIHRPVSDVDALRAAASHTSLTEDLALTLLDRRDIPSAVLDDLSKNGRVMKYRKVLLAVMQHPHTPKHVSLPIIRRLYTFELMNVTLLPSVAADVKLAAEETLVSRFGTIAAGEKLTLGKQGSARVAAGLLNDPNRRVVAAALDNPYLTEAWVIKAVVRKDASEILAHHVSRHQKWSVRKDVRAALLRNELTPLANTIEFASVFSIADLKDIFYQSALPEKTKEYLLTIAEAREAKKRGHPPPSGS